MTRASATLTVLLGLVFLIAAVLLVSSGTFSSVSYQLDHEPVANVTDASDGIKNVTVTDLADLRVRFTDTAAQLGLSAVYLYSDATTDSQPESKQLLTPRERVVQFDHSASFNTTYTVLAVDGSNRIRERATVRIDPVAIEEGERDV